VKRTKPLEALLDDYRDAATSHGTATRDGKHRAANRAADRLADIVRELRTRDAQERAAFLELMEDPDIGVRCWASTHALEFSPTRAEAVLEAIAAGRSSFEELSAHHALEEWRSGRLTPP
jgi:hypothetical protein